MANMNKLRESLQSAVAALDEDEIVEVAEEVAEAVAEEVAEEAAPEQTVHVEVPVTVVSEGGDNVEVDETDMSNHEESGPGDEITEETTETDASEDVESESSDDGDDDEHGPDTDSDPEPEHWSQRRIGRRRR